MHRKHTIVAGLMTAAALAVGAPLGAHALLSQTSEAIDSPDDETSEDDAHRRVATLVHAKLIELGQLAMNQTIETSVLLVNPSDAPITINGIKPSCGCTTIDDHAGRVIEAGGAAHIDVTLRAKKKPGISKPMLAFTFDNHEPLKVAMRFETVEREASRGADEPAPGPASALRYVDAAVDLGEHDSGAIVKDALWVVNTGDAPVRIESVVAGCGCTTIENEDAISGEIAPGAAREIRLNMKAPKESGQRVTKPVKITIASTDQPITARLTIASRAASAH